MVRFPAPASLVLAKIRWFYFSLQHDAHSAFTRLHLEIPPTSTPMHEGANIVTAREGFRPKPQV